MSLLAEAGITTIFVLLFTQYITLLSDILLQRRIDKIEILFWLVPFVSFFRDIIEGLTQRYKEPACKLDRTRFGADIERVCKRHIVNFNINSLYGYHIRNFVDDIVRESKKENEQ